MNRRDSRIESEQIRNMIVASITARQIQGLEFQIMSQVNSGLTDPLSTNFHYYISFITDIMGSRIHAETRISVNYDSYDLETSIDFQIDCCLSDFQEKIIDEIDRRFDKKL